MHYLVRMLVKADTAAEALEQAVKDCDDMVEQGIIDWYDMDGRWNKSKAHSLNSAKGERLIEEGMQYNREQFDESLKAIRYMMENFTDDQIYNGDFKTGQHDDAGFYLSRYQFSVADGRSNCAAVYCMDGNLWGSRIDSDRELESCIKDENKKKLWVVPVDVHN